MHCYGGVDEVGSGIAGEPFFFSSLFHGIYSFKDVFQWSHRLFLLVLSGFEIPQLPTVLVGILQCRLSQLLSDARKSAFLQSLHHKSWDHGLEAKKSWRWIEISETVDGRNPKQPPEMYKTL